MRISGEVRNQLGLKFAVLFPHLDERQRRLLMGAEARVLGHGGIRAVAQAAQVSETTVRKGVNELEDGAEPLGRIRRPGGGRKRAAEADPELRPALLALVEPDIRGDRCAGRRSPPADSPTSSPGRATVSRRIPSPTFCGRRDSAFRPTPRPSRVPSIPTGMPSSTTSTTGPRSTWAPATR